MPGRVLAALPEPAAAIQCNPARPASLCLCSIGGELATQQVAVGERTGSPFSPVTSSLALPIIPHPAPITHPLPLRTLFCSGTLALCRVLYGPRQLSPAATSSTATRAALLPCLALRPFPEYPALISPKLIRHHSFSALNHSPRTIRFSSHHPAGQQTCPLPVLPPPT